MRQLTVTRPRQKLRNPRRRLRALERWAEQFRGFYPERPGARRRYLNYKIPVLDRLVEGPQARLAWRRAAITQLLTAARHLVEAKPPHEVGRSWVAVLLSEPNLWSSEVTVFFDEDYYRSFIPDAQERLDDSLIDRYGLPRDDRFAEDGYEVIWRDEDEPDDAEPFRERRFTIGERLA